MCKVSILVPIYNVELYIERCACSLFEQTFTDVEYIFVDDCSPDNSISILEEVICRYPDIKDVRVIKHPRNQGLAVARNTAVKNATGTYLLHVDSDDYLEKDAVQLLYEKAIATNADVVICDYKLIFQNKEQILLLNYNEHASEYTKMLLKRKAVTGIVGKLIKRYLIIQNNLYAIAGLNQGEDYLVTPRIAYYSSIIQKVNSPLYNYEKNNSASYTANVNRNAVENIIEVENILIKFFSEIKDASVYKEALNLSKLYNKITLLYSADFSSYKIIAPLYRDVHWLSANIELKHKCILALMHLGLCHLVYFIIQLVKKYRRNNLC